MRLKIKTIEAACQAPSLWHLAELTRARGGPWHKVWHHCGKVNPGMRIDNLVIE